MAFVERLALPHRERAEGEGELVGVAGVGCRGEVRGHLKHFALLVPSWIIRRRAQQPGVTDDGGDSLYIICRYEPVEQRPPARWRRVRVATYVDCQRGQHQVVGGMTDFHREIVESFRCVEPQRAERIEVGDVGTPSAHRLGDLGQRPLQNSRHLQQAPGARLVGARQPQQRRGVVGGPSEWLVALRPEPFEQLSAGSGVAGSSCCLERQGNRLVQRRHTVQADDAVLDAEPTVDRLRRGQRHVATVTDGRWRVRRQRRLPRRSASTLGCAPSRPSSVRGRAGSTPTGCRTVAR